MSCSSLNSKQFWIGSNYFWKLSFFEDFFGLTAPTQELALFTAFWKRHYTEDTLIETALTGECPYTNSKIISSRCVHRAVYTDCCVISQVLVKALSLKYKYLENSCSAKMQCNTFILLICTLMPYPCSQFCADVKFDIRFDNRFDVKLGDSFHANHTINFGTKLRSYGIV